MLLYPALCWFSNMCQQRVFDLMMILNPHKKINGFCWRKSRLRSTVLQIMQFDILNRERLGLPLILFYFLSFSYINSIHKHKNRLEKKIW